MSPTPSILIIAGETSGDAHGAELVKQLPSHYNVTAMGSSNLRQAGADILVDSSDLGVVGFIEIIKIISKIRSAYKVISNHIKTQKPDLVILIDYPGFNLRMAKVAKRAGCKVLYYISPQLWAWRKGRIKIIKRYVDQMAVILPFEVDFYRQHGVPAQYVEHPLVQDITNLPNKIQAREHLNLDPQSKIIGLLPGSRHSEVNFLMPTLVAAAKTLKQRYPNAIFLLPLAPHISPDLIQQKLNGLKVTITQALYPTLAACDALIATSGTVTLQAGLVNTPMVVIYKGSKLTHAIAKLIVKVKYICLCNIIADQEIVKELVQYEANVDNIVTEVSKILDDPQYRTQMQQALKNISAKLSHNPSQTSISQLASALIES